MKKNVTYRIVISCCAVPVFASFAAAALSAETQETSISLLQEKKQNEIISGLYRDVKGLSARQKELEKKQNESIPGLSRDMKDLSAQQKDLNKKLSDFQSELANLSKQNELLKQENRKLTLELGSIKKVLPVSKNGNTEPGDARSYYQQAEADMKANNLEQAIGGFEKSLSLDPRNAQAHYNLGLLYEHARNNRRESIYHLKKYLQLSNDPEKKEEVIYLIRMENDNQSIWELKDIK